MRIGDVEIELEGEHSRVIELMGGLSLFDFIKELQETVGELPPPTISEMPEAEAKEYAPPLGKPSSVTEALTTLFKTDWGKKPRTLSEVMGVLETNGLYYRKAAVAKILVDLTKNRQVRRLGSRGNFQYVAT